MDVRQLSTSTTARGVAQLAEMLAQRAASGLPIEWSDALSVGVPTIDGQHRVLIAYINQLSSAIKRQQSATVMGLVLAGLEGYTRVHFKFEERIFDRLHWHDSEDHARGHRMFEQQIAGFRSRFAAGDTQLAVSVLEFMVRWLAEHILVDDMAYSEFFHEHHVH